MSITKFIKLDEFIKARIKDLDERRNEYTESGLVEQLDVALWDIQQYVDTLIQEYDDK